MKWAEGQSGLLNSVTLCRCGRVNERWLVNLHTGVAFSCVSQSSTRDSEAVRVDATTPILRNVVGCRVDSVLAVVVHSKVATHSRCEFCSILL